MNGVHYQHLLDLNSNFWWGGGGGGSVRFVSTLSRKCSRPTIELYLFLIRFSRISIVGGWKRDVISLIYAAPNASA